MRIPNKLTTGAREWIFLVAMLCATVCFGQSTITNLPTLGGSFVSATALNKVGQVTGYSTTTGDAAQHAFLFSGGVMYDLGTLGGTFSQASGLNASGQIIGAASTTDDM